VTSTLLTVVTAYLGLVVVLGAAAGLGVRCSPAVRTGVVVAELLLVVQLLIDIATLLKGHRPAELVTHAGYAVVSVVLFPVLLSRPSDAPSRADHLVVVVAAVAALVVSVRLHATWKA
jgi:hypothetical protein